jgi:hypothetical protein
MSQTLRACHPCKKQGQRIIIPNIKEYCSLIPIIRSPTYYPYRPNTLLNPKTYNSVIIKTSCLVIYFLAFYWHGCLLLLTLAKLFIFSNASSLAIS